MGAYKKKYIIVCNGQVWGKGIYTMDEIKKLLNEGTIPNYSDICEIKRKKYVEKGVRGESRGKLLLKDFWVPAK